MSINLVKLKPKGINIEYHVVILVEYAQWYGIILFYLTLFFLLETYFPLQK